MLLCFTTKIALGFVPNLRERAIHSTTPAARAKLGSVKAALRTHSMDLGTTQADFEAPLVHGRLSPPVNSFNLPFRCDSADYTSFIRIPPTLTLFSAIHELNCLYTYC